MLKFIFLSALFFSTYAFSELKTVPYVDLNKYAGTWYQIARNPLFFENGCVCSRQVLTPSSNGAIAVYNSCNFQTPTGPMKEIRGFATNDDPSSNSKFTVDFNLPKKGAYWIIGLDSDYRYTVVSDPTLTSLYILSKTPALEDFLYAEAVNKAAEQVDVSKLLITEQFNCSYPN